MGKPHETPCCQAFGQREPDPYRTVIAGCQCRLEERSLVHVLTNLHAGLCVAAVYVFISAAFLLVSHGHRGIDYTAFLGHSAGFHRRSIVLRHGKQLHRVADTHSAQTHRARSIRIIGILSRPHIGIEVAKVQLPLRKIVLRLCSAAHYLYVRAVVPLRNGQPESVQGAE